MKARTSIALAAAALLAGTVAASAAGMQQSNAGDKMAPLASDTLSLSSTQRKAAWKDLYTGSLNQKAPAGFSAVTGAVVPNTVTTAPSPVRRRATSRRSAVPASPCCSTNW